MYKQSHWFVQEAPIPRYTFRVAEMRTPKVSTKYEKYLLTHNIPNLLNNIKNSIDFTKPLNFSKARTRQKLIESENYLCYLMLCFAYLHSL